MEAALANVPPISTPGVLISSIDDVHKVMRTVPSHENLLAPGGAAISALHSNLTSLTRATWSPFAFQGVIEVDWTGKEKDAMDRNLLALRETFELLEEVTFILPYHDDDLLSFLTHSQTLCAAPSFTLFAPQKAMTVPLRPPPSENETSSLADPSQQLTCATDVCRDIIVASHGRIASFQRDVNVSAPFPIFF
jgi:hypothetical protein